MRKRMVEQDVEELARERVRKTFDRYDHVAVHFSGGKDSTCCLHLTLDEARKRGRLPLDVVFFDEEAQCPETIEYMHHVQEMPDVALRWYCLPVKHRNACSRRHPYWYPWAPEDEHKWCRPLPRGALTTLAGFERHAIPECKPLLYPPSMGQVGAILGLRAAESLRRYRGVTQRVYENYISQAHNAAHVYVVKPIYDWTTDDVWTAPQKFGWEYNPAYDVMTKAGMPRHVQRVCPPYGEEPLQNLWMYSVCWPELWAKMSVRVPGAATAGRYCRSPLYAFGAVGRPEGQTWQHLIGLALEKWGEDNARTIAGRIKGFVDLHNKDCPGQPIDDEPHPVSGVGWKMLYTIAIRGDLKNRRNRRLVSTPTPVGEEGRR